MHQINQHVTKKTIRPSKPRTSITIEIILEEALMHISIRSTLLQHIDTLKNLLLILQINHTIKPYIRSIGTNNK